MSKPLEIPDIASIEAFVAKPLGPSDWFTVTQEQIDDFARATGDHQWIHTDVERAKHESPFGTTIAHGYLTIALAPALLPQLVRVGRASRTINYGADKIRLPVPVPAGARVRLSGAIKHVRSVPGGAARVTIGLVFHVEGNKRPCCTADAIYVYFP
ncbi:MAG: MaoC family dehydratase [bacterium]|nr:MaoC family dehydratase [bacterium]MCP5043001.1 MaoC family dehydratase [bacterium]